MLDRVSRHVPHSLRRLVTAPVFSLVIVVTLAIAIGANAAVFTLIDQLLLKPLPVSQPDTLVIVNARSMPRLKGGSAVIGGRLPNGTRFWAMNYSLFTMLTERVPVFQTTFAKRIVRGTILVGDAPAEAWGELVSGNFFPTLGIKAALGRLLGPTDDSPGASSVVVLSHGYWQRQFGGDRAVVGRTIRISGFPVTVVGVTAAGFTGMEGARASDFFAPLDLCDTLWPAKAPYRMKDDGASFLTMMARLRAGTTIEQAEARASQVYKQLLADALGRNAFSAKDLQLIAGYQLSLIPGGLAGSQGGVSPQLLLALRLLMVMAVVLLLISAGNVTNLILAREVRRRREVAVRFALGASRARLLGERLVESLALAFASGAASLIAAAWLANALLVMLPVSPEQTSVVTTPGRQTLLFIAVVSLVSGILVWLASSIQATRRGALPSLSDSSTGEGRPHGLGFRRGLLVLQAALSLALLCGAGMLAHSLYNLTSVDAGFRTKGLTTFKLQPAATSTKAEAFVQPLRNVLDALAATSGVQGATATTELPALEGGGGTCCVVGGNVPVNAEKAVLVDDVFVTPGFFSTIGMPVVRGRDLSAEDVAGGQKVAVINESLARALFGDGDPLGQMIGGQYQALDTRVVGIVKDARAGVRQPACPAMYEPWAQHPLAWATVVVRTRDDRALDLATIRGVVGRVDPSMPITRVSTLDGLIADTLARDRMLALLSSAIGALAAFLCGLGLFGIMNYRVANRAREIGIRVALGAAARSVQWLIVREAIVVIAIGIPLGLAGYVASSRILGSLLYQLSPTDTTTMASGVCLLAIVTVAAAFVPARRATRLDPAVTLRRE